MRTSENCDVDPCTPCVCERLSTPSEEGYARIVLCGSTILKTALEPSQHYLGINTAIE